MKNISRFKIKFLTMIAALFLIAAYAEASIVVRAVVVNPSSVQKKRVPFKSYLPKEIKPENIIDAGDLEMAYDPKENAYYVFKDFELQPKEAVTVEIEMEDVWKIAEAEISSLREEAGKLTKVLANTDYYERAAYLKNSIESKLNQVEHTQNTQNPNPGGYISDFRDNLKLIESVKADLAAAKSLVTEAKNIAPMLTWKLIIAILVFLGLLGLIFFIVWQRQIKSLAEVTDDFAGDKSKEETGLHEEGERRQATEEKKSAITDIEERLKPSQ
ncbi:MAG TPA: hypothetical protein PLU24_02185 [Candidatus Omnitrophota bacterium]|nr:hypothetical protein [Candidatus Omnitrophota bacterium]